LNINLHIHLNKLYVPIVRQNKSIKRLQQSNIDNNTSSGRVHFLHYKKACTFTIRMIKKTVRVFHSCPYPLSMATNLPVKLIHVSA